jgi:hypothetical protein
MTASIPAIAAISQVGRLARCSQKASFGVFDGRFAGDFRDV